MATKKSVKIKSLAEPGLSNFLGNMVKNDYNSFVS